MKDKLFVSDLDGTLLNRHCELTPYSRKAIHELLESNVNFTIATARGIHSVKQILGNIPFKLPVICNNGAYIRDFSTRGSLEQNAFQKEIVHEVLAKTENHGLEPYISSTNGIRDFISYNLVINEGMKWFENDMLRANDPRLNPNCHYGEVINHEITCLTIIDKLSPVKALKNELDEHFGEHIQTNIMINPYQGKYHWLTVQDVKANKGQALNWLAENYGFKKENITVFGDQVNDIPLFNAAGKRVAVKSGIESVKTMADIVIGSNNDNAVVSYIKSQI